MHCTCSGAVLQIMVTWESYSYFCAIFHEQIDMHVQCACTWLFCGTDGLICCLPLSQRFYSHKLNRSCHFLYRNLGGEIGYDGDFLVFEGSHFRNGFMYKQFGTNAIVSGGHCTML